MAWKAHNAAKDMHDRLKAAGYPARAIQNLDLMCGPGLKAAKQLRPNMVEGNSITFLIGDRGPGKTQIATWIGAQRILAGAGCGVYRKALDLWSEIKATWRKDSGTTEDEVIRRFKRSAFLVVDEAQERGDTEADRLWCDRMLTHLIDHRYDAMLPTLLVANLDVAGYDRTIPASVRSRVSECGGVKLCDWPSYRQ